MANVKTKARRVLFRFPKREKSTGYIYKSRLPAKTARFDMITVFAIVVGNEGGVFVRDWVFGWEGAQRTRVQWRDWLSDHFGKILRENILDSYQEKYGGFWRLHTLIGWTTNANQRTQHTKVSKKRNKTKRTRKRNV